MGRPQLRTIAVMGDTLLASLLFRTVLRAAIAVFSCIAGQSPLTAGRCRAGMTAS